MLGSTPLSAVLGSGVDSTNHESVRSYIRACCDAGLSVLLVIPGTKQPFDGRTARKRNADDKAVQAEAKESGRRDWRKVKSPSGLALATSDKTVLTRKGGYLDNYIAAFGPDVAVNLAIEVGGSNVIVVDCDTAGQYAKFIDVSGAPADMPPTIVTPGSQDADGNWVHSDGGHFYFTVPEGAELPTNLGSLTWGAEDGFAVLWHRRYVLIPPSTRPEGAYELVGRDYPAPGWLIDAITEKASAKASRIFDNANPSDDPITNSIDEWSESISWEDILEPLGWTPTARPDQCGCDVWTAPGTHASPKSATAHDSGCQLGRYTETNAPLHIWTDNPGEPFDAYVESSGTKTLSKLQAVAWSNYQGRVGDAMDELGLGTPVHTIERETGVNTREIGEEVDAGHDVAAEIKMPDHTSGPESGGTKTEWPLPTGVRVDGTDLTGEEIDDWAEDVGPTPFDDEAEDPDPDVFEPGLQGVPMIAPFSHWRDMPPPEYIIDGLIEHGGLSCIIGPPGVGKSSVALDMACHIATGKPWQGRKVLKTRVLYLPGEGLSGAVQRIKTWAAVNETSDDLLDDGLRLGNSIIQLGASTEAWGMLAEYIIRQRVGMIIFDTFARMSLGIEENSATEVGRAVVRFDQVRRLTNAGVLIVHHTAKGNPTAGRGSSALNGALDSELLVSDGQWEFDELGIGGEHGKVPSGKKIQLSTTKQKNAEQLDHPMPLLMRSHDAYGAPYITGPGGEIDPMLGQVVLARPVEEPIIETAIRILTFVDQFPEQGATRAEIASGVRPDPYTARRRDAPKAWKQKVAVAIDRALHYELIETASGQRLGARYVPGTVSAEAARIAHAAEVITDTG